MSTPKLASIATILLTLTAACGDTDEPTLVLDTSTPTDDGSDETGIDTGSEGAPPPDLPGEDAPPELISLLVNGSETPPTLFAAAYVEAVATVTDDHGVDHVDFYVDQEKLASDEEAPFTARIPFRSSSENGSRVIRVVAYDGSGQGIDKELKIEIDLPKRGTVMWAKDKNPDLPTWTSVVLDEEEESLTTFGEGLAARFSAEGQLVGVWELSAFDNVALNTVRATARPEGGFLALAAPDSAGYLLLQALNADLEVVWGKPYTSIPNPSEIELRALRLVDDRALFAGTRLPAGAVHRCPWVVRTEPISAGADFDWQKSLDCSGEFSHESIVALTLGPRGTIYAVHSQLPDLTELVAMSRAGAVLWTKALEETVRVKSMTVDSGGNLHLAGHSFIDNSSHGYLASYTEEGELRWTWTAENDLVESADFESFELIDFDATANRLVSVAIDDDYESEAAAIIVERSPSGVPGVVYGFYPGAGSYFHPTGIVIDSLGYVYLVGQSNDTQIVKLHP